MPLESEFPVTAGFGLKALPLDRYPLYSTASVDVASANLLKSMAPKSVRSKVVQELKPNQSKFFCRHNAVQFPNLSINAISYGAAMSLDLRDVETNLFLVVVTRGSCWIESGDLSFAVHPNETFIINPGQPIRAFLSEDFEEIVIGINADTVGPAIFRLIDRPISVPLQFDMMPRPFSDGGGSLIRFLFLLLTELDAEQSAIKFNAVKNLYEQTLVSLMLTSMPHNYSEWLQRGVPAAAPHYVYRAERYIRDNLNSTLTLDEIVTVSGVGVRALHQGFRKFRRTTPMLFLRECRLQHAKAQLEDNGLRDWSIAQIAHNSGFEHPSKFSQIYKSRFGELPSDTRRSALCA